MSDKTPSQESPPLAEPSPAVAYFINITVSNKKLHDQFPNIRIRIPKLLVKTVKNSRRRIQGSDSSGRRRIQGSDGSGSSSNENTSKTKKRWGTPKKLFPVLLKFFRGKKKSMTTTISSGENRFFEQGESSNDSASSATVSIINSTNSQNSEKHPLFSAFSLATRSPLCDLRGKICVACRLSLEEEKEKEEEWLGFGEKQERLGEIVSCTINSSDPINFDLSEIWETSLTETEEEKQEEDENNDDNEQELCKKRILMGERCKPLNFSGSLRYDENGNSQPE